MRRQELHPRTEALNKTQKNKSKKARTEALSWLATEFPHAFDNTLRISPLKTGIMDDVLLHADKAADAGVSKSKLRQAVVLFTRRIDYLACLKAREMRVNLEGLPVSVVSEEEAERASAKIKKRIEKSARNARRLTNKTSNYPKQATHLNNNTSQAPYNHEVSSYYHDHPANYNPPSSSSNASRPSVMVRHKTSRSFDPSAVARLKEKLGLSRKITTTETEKELVE